MTPVLNTEAGTYREPGPDGTVNSGTDTRQADAGHYGPSQKGGMFLAPVRAESQTEDLDQRGVM